MGLKLKAVLLEWDIEDRTIYEAFMLCALSSVLHTVL
jgi:hypothetical protein